MKKLLALTLSGVSGLTMAQTPAVNLMPDGSRDMYIGLGASVHPRYEGADDHRTRALPLLQVQFSNGVFLSGMSAGWHLSDNPSIEYGPLLAVHAGRTESGIGGKLGGVTDGGLSILPPVIASGADKAGTNLLKGLPEIDARLTGGGFLHYYLTPRLRLNNTLLYGAGRRGLAWEASLQTVAASELSSPHRVSFSAGFTAVNRQYNQTFFGVSGDDARNSHLPVHLPDGGIKDVFAGARWNWTLSPSWILTSSARVSRLAGDAKKSPLVERSTQYTITTGLAYRF